MSRVVDRLRRVRGRSRSALTEAERRLLESPLFDEEWYAAQAGSQPDRLSAVRHYLSIGVARELQPHPLFDPRFVKQHWTEQRLQRLGAGDPLELYLRRRLFATPTHPLFDTAGYLRRAPEAAAHPAGPVGHYSEIGAGAGAPANDWLDPDVDLRDWLRERREEWHGGALRSTTATHAGTAATDVVSVVMVATAADRAVGDALASVLAWDREDSTHRVEAHVLALEEDATQAAVLESLPLRFPGVEVFHGGLSPADLLDRARGDRVVLLHPAATSREDWLTQALRLLDDPGVVAVQPLLLRSGGAVWSAGVVPVGAGYRLLEGFPPEDARGLFGIDLPAVSREAVVLRRGLLDGSAQGHLRLSVPAVTLMPEPATSAAPLVGTGAAERSLWSAVGFDLTGHDELGRPLLRRRAVEVIEGAPRLRWAIKNPAVPGPAGDRWGDTHFADALARGLRRHGQEVVIDRRSEHHRVTAHHDDVVLALRGRIPYRPMAGQLTLGWVISHPEEVTAEEAARFDRLFAASALWARRRSADWGIRVEPLLQATDPQLFHPDRAEPDSGADLVFVGSHRGGDRPLLEWAVAAGLPLAVYGAGWEGRVPAASLMGDYLANDELGAVYRAAGVVLNDHWEDMRTEGFLSNRLFDAVASGARVISDDVAGLREVFGPQVQVARNSEELVRLASAPDPDALFGDDALRRAAAATVHQEHSFEHRAAQLVAIVAEEMSRRG